MCDLFFQRQRKCSNNVINSIHIYIWARAHFGMIQCCNGMEWNGTESVFQYYNSEIAPHRKGNGVVERIKKQRVSELRSCMCMRVREPNIGNVRSERRTIIITFMLNLFIGCLSIDRCLPFSMSIYRLASCLRTHLFRTIKCGIHAHTFKQTYAKISLQRLLDVYSDCVSVLIKWRYNKLSSCSCTRTQRSKCVRILYYCVYETQ